MQGCDAVCHLAAAADVDEVATDPLVCRARQRARHRVACSRRRGGPKSPASIYASTVWVYSDVEAEVVDEDTLLRAPAHLYTATKLAGELYCRSYGELYGVESVGRCVSGSRTARARGRRPSSRRSSRGRAPASR